MQTSGGTYKYIFGTYHLYIEKLFEVHPAIEKGLREGALNTIIHVSNYHERESQESHGDISGPWFWAFVAEM